MPPLLIIFAAGLTREVTNEEEVEMAAKHANAHNFIMDFPQVKRIACC